MSERIGADRYLQAVEKFARLFVAIADGRNGVEDRNRRLVTGEGEYLLGVRDGLKIVGLRAARDQHKIGGFRGGKGGLLVARGRVDHGKVHPVLFSLCEGGSQPSRAARR